MVAKATTNEKYENMKPKKDKKNPDPESKR